MRVLHVREFFVEQAHVVIVNERDGADHIAVRLLPGALHQLVADQVAKRFRAVAVTPRRDQVVELLEEVRVDRHSYPAEFAHSYRH